MTYPTPQQRQDNEDELRILWLLRYLKVQTSYDARIRTVLSQAAADAYSELLNLASSATFSDSVRSVQIRQLIKELATINKKLFNELLVIIKNGQAESAKAAVEAFADQDEAYLRAAFQGTHRRTGIDLARFIAGQKQSAGIHVASAIRNIEQRGDYPLSARVYHTRQIANGWIRREVTTGILKGDGAKEIATAVRSSIRSSTPGGVSYAAMRLGRTEINNAFHATSVELAKDRPWVEGMLWHLSKVHEFEEGHAPEVCETYAGQVFSVDRVPKKPHPQCRCFVTPQLEPFDVFVRHLTAGQYRDWMYSAA